MEFAIDTPRLWSDRSDAVFTVEVTDNGIVIANGGDGNSITFNDEWSGCHHAKSSPLTYFFANHYGVYIPDVIGMCVETCWLKYANDPTFDITSTLTELFNWIRNIAATQPRCIS